MSLSHHLNIRVAGKQSRWGDLRTWAHGRVESWPQPVRVEGAAARPAPCAGCSVPEDSTVPPAISQHTAGCTLSAHEGFVAASSSVPLTLYWAVAFLCCHRDSDLVVSSSTWRLCARFPARHTCSRSVVLAPACEARISCSVEMQLKELRNVGSAGVRGGLGGMEGMQRSPLMGPPDTAESPETSEAGRAQVVGGNPWTLRKLWGFEEPHTLC